MAQLTMYPAMAGSPKTALSSTLASDATTAYVDNLEKLPAAPNVVTFWIVEETWERCVYSAKSAETGPGTITIARSGAGHASSAGNAGLEWAAGTKVARNPGELDHTLFKANIEDLETNKITAAGVTYENLSANSDIGTGATQVAQGNHTHTPASLGAASGSTATKTLYVYGDATGTGDGSTKANGFTTLAACLAAMPDMINHAYVIKMCAASAPYAATTVQKTVGAGSITIEGEFYKNGTVASAGSTVGKFNTQAGDTGAASGDRVLMIKYSGTVGASTPSDGFIDTVASVSGTEVTLTDRTSDAFDTSWRYVIVRTTISKLVLNCIDNVTVRGLYINSALTQALYVANCINPMISSVIVDTSERISIQWSSGGIDTSQYVWEYIAARSTKTESWGRALQFDMLQATIKNCLFECAAANSGGSLSVAIVNIGSGYLNLFYSVVRGYGTGIQNGVFVAGAAVCQPHACLIDGIDASHKMPIALYAKYGGTITTGINTFGDNITTQKSPANWAATTDGSYIT